MKSRGFLTIIVLALVLMFGLGIVPAAEPSRSSKGGRNDVASLTELEALARGRAESTGARARLPLAAPTGEIDALEPAGSGRIPNYLRVFAVMPQGAAPFSRLIRTFIFGGTVAPETKLAMGLRVAQVNRSPYVAVHLQRLLRATGGGESRLAKLRSGQTGALPAEMRIAIRYAELLTRDIHGITDPEFTAVRQAFNDSQVVELTMAVCFFNYFTRFSEALNLPVEAWALDPEALPAIPKIVPGELTRARIGLISDEEMRAVVAADRLAQDPATRNTGLGLAIANSQRAMMRVPDLQAAWRSYGTAVRADSRIGREIQLHVSLAVSMANGCRYCTVHQIVGLRRLGVDPAKLLSLRKDDQALTPRELAAVRFARQLTATPSAITDRDFNPLKAEFGEYGALEVVLQTGAFSFMNRFTDNLRLPSEDEAIHVYQRVFGEK
jgi:AhpD family alkylhydroperoxidase